MFRRILIANRGEIAVRIIRACREMGVETVAVYSDADARARHVALADRAVRIGPPAASASYLSTEAILDAAKATGAEAIHPGYGFVAENHDFAFACERAGLTFIGPPPQVIQQMGSKIAARQLAARAGAPVVPGDTPADQRDESIAAAARRIGFPVLLKPAEGGGGIGMKAVSEEAELLPAIARARREAQAAFGDGTLYVERLITRPRHIEVQILADSHGNVVHLFERECSIQRRHQKVIEETPSVALTPALRKRMGEAAVAVARTAGYRNAGTIEFLLDTAGHEAPPYQDRARRKAPPDEQEDAAAFYFLEMNTRLQVEHPVTEQVTGVDIVRAQLAVASGEPLPWTQDQLSQRGHAIEARVYAEDAARNDLPQAGPLLLYREPSMPGVRVDSGFAEGDEVSVHYDPLIAKVIAWGETRETARARLLTALRDYPILGIHTNIALLLELLDHPRFIAGDIDTQFLDQEGDDIRARLVTEPPPDVLEVATATARTPSPAAQGSQPPVSDPWDTLRGLRV